MDKAAVKLVPSILAADFARLGEQVAEAEQAGADRIHADVMDGHFVANISMGAPIVASLRRVTGLHVETHLMISAPDFLLEECVEAEVRFVSRALGGQRQFAATDHGGFGLKEELVAQLRAVGHEVVDFGAHGLTPSDDYPDFVVPLARAVAEGKVESGVAICGSGVGASVCANLPGVRAGLVHDHFSARQGVEDDHMNIICMGGRTVGPSVAWDLVETFLAARFSQAERHLRRLSKVASLEGQLMSDRRGTEIRSA